YSATYAAIGGTMDAGNWYEGGTSNSITVGNGGLLYVGDTLHNRNTTGTSGLNIRPGGVVDVGNYYQANGAYLNIYTDSSGTNTGFLYVDDTAEFEAGAKIGFDAVAALDIGAIYTNLIIETGTLVVDGVTNATTADLAALENTGGFLVSYDLWETNQNIYATFSRRSISDGGGFDAGSMLDQIGNEIDRLAAQGNIAASNQVEILSSMGSDQERKLQMEQMYAYQLPTFMHNQDVFGGIDQVRARGASIRGTSAKGTLPKPKGVAGPHVADQGLQGWAKVYGSYGNRDKDDNSGYADGYDVQSYGTVIGMDQAFGDWLFGVAGGYAGSNIKGDNNDESDATTGYGILYANYGSQDWFGDVVASYGLTSMDNKSGTDFDVTSSVDASQTAFYIGGGKEFKDPDGSRALLHPLLGLQVSQFNQDAYTEKSANAVAKNVDSYDRWSYQSILGATMILPATGKTVDLETQLRAHWLHEFNGDNETVGYTLVGSSQPGQFVLRSPDQNVGQFGIGCVAKWQNGLQLRADLDGQVSSTFYSATVSGALLYEF
ncbi:MAG: autotransporter domain-containing protein, partial [Kiritimatiellales bacterium]|nr:autotransporter domain-containing protein [Kiritimatiellales bacterium]